MVHSFANNLGLTTTFNKNVAQVERT